ncbi:M1 family metallopeptidase [Pendulispora albinea]|uniref:Aminopeptidase N n=1 Tax=Pendulispora albinea TaxID=2741071 RepID=A0ABZ2M6R1_9BACT
MRSLSLRRFPKIMLGIATVLLGGSAIAAGGPGAPGLGDPYYPNDGNGGYDVDHYDLRLTYRPSSDQLSGTTTIKATAVQDLTAFNLDFALSVSAINVNGAAARFTRSGAEYTVTPAAELPASKPFTVEVTYSDVPSRVSGSTWVKTSNGALAVNEPHIARYWFPSSDHPRDKATFDVSIAVPDDGTTVVSNGAFLGSAVETGGLKRWNWRNVNPTATYLTFVTIGKFTVNHATAGGRPYITAYASNVTGATLTNARNSLNRTPDIIDYESSVFGPYPFAAIGGVVVPNLSFALEVQTRPVYGTAFFGSRANTSVVAHENAHQWWGDNVSGDTWRNIWLHEGFATYAEWLWSEHNGTGTAQQIANSTYNSRPASSSFWQVVVANPGAGNEFNAAIYDRGGLAVHALRVAVGDTAFFNILKTWQSERKYSTGTIEQFIATSERVSGKSLQAVFNTWLFTRGRPASPPGAAFDAEAFAAEPEPPAFAEIQETHRLLAEQHHAH